jgi:hypothetical protein
MGEHIGNKGKMKKKILLHPHNLKGKKARHLERMFGPSTLGPSN